jgi:mevalonate kinase
MIMLQATAPGKVILFGEHAVVYGRAAIAAPVSQVRASAVVSGSDTPGVRLIAPDLGADFLLAGANENEPLASGTPTAAALIRALALYLERPDLATNERVSALTYEVERFYHGTPSGIDNTVVAYEQPVYFVRRRPHNVIETFGVARPIRLLVADTGVASSTRVVVGDVRRQWQEEADRFEALFDACGRISQAARRAIETGDEAAVGQLMNENHLLLQQMTVSSPELDYLVGLAREAGALGAKLSGAGRGGNMIALVSEESETAVRHALLGAGARHVLASIM